MKKEKKPFRTMCVKQVDEGRDELCGFTSRAESS